MAHPTLHGIVPPIITPMNADESINIPELRNQIERQIAGGVHGIFCFGTNGEGYILSMKEKEEILEATIDQVAGRVPVYAGTGCISTADTVYMSRRAEKWARTSSPSSRRASLLRARRSSTATMSRWQST